MNLIELPDDMLCKIKEYLDKYKLQDYFNIWKMKTPKKILLRNYNITKKIRILKRMYENANEYNRNRNNFYSYIINTEDNYKIDENNSIYNDIFSILQYIEEKSIEENNKNDLNMDDLISYLEESYYNERDILNYIIIHYNDYLIYNKEHDDIYKKITIKNIKNKAMDYLYLYYGLYKL